MARSHHGHGLRGELIIVEVVGFDQQRDDIVLGRGQVRVFLEGSTALAHVVAREDGQLLLNRVDAAGDVPWNLSNNPLGNDDCNTRLEIVS